MDRNELKVQALLEKISSLTTNYENQIADLRVEVTVISQELQDIQKKSAEQLNGDAGEVPEATEAEVQG